MAAPSSSDPRQLAAEMFLTSVGPALVKQVATILHPHGIPVMPLKGVLLQRLVYGEGTFRAISDVDLVVPEDRFADAFSILTAAGFSRARWEGGGWEVTLRNPAGPPLGVDLHRRLSRTTRSTLTTKGLFERGSTNTDLFGAPVVLPCADDLFAHLLLHAALHFINLGELHRPGDFVAVADALSMDAGRCAEHIRECRLLPHALVMLPMIAKRNGGPFLHDLMRALGDRPWWTARARAAGWAVQDVCSRFPPGRQARRLAGLALAPSLPAAVASAVWDRLGGILWSRDRS